MSLDWKMNVQTEQGILYMSCCPLLEVSLSKSSVFISVEHMADAQDSQVKCYRLCLDSHKQLSQHS